MKKNKKLIIGILLITTLLGGCSMKDINTEDMKDISTEDTQASYPLEEIGRVIPNSLTHEYRDTQTGVHYFAYRDRITPRYNADGSLYVD